jgi:hypothetical protein
MSHDRDALPHSRWGVSFLPATLAPIPAPAPGPGT